MARSENLFLKYVLFTSCLMLGYLSKAKAQNNRLVLSADIAQMANDSIIYLYGFNSGYCDSTYVKNHRFSFDANLPEGGDIFVVQFGKAGDEKQGLLLYLEPGKVSLKGEGPYFDNLSFSNNKFLQEFLEMSRTIGDTSAQFREVKEKMEIWRMAHYGGDEEAAESIMKEIRVMQKKCRNKGVEWMDKHLASGVSSFMLNTTMYDILSPGEKTTYINKFVANGQNNSILKKMVKGIAGTVNLYAAGMQAPAFTQPDLNGKSFSLEDFKGKYVLVDFWASWCMPCREQTPFLKAAYEKFRHKNFTIVSISMDSKKEQWMKAMEEDKMPWLQLSDLKATDNTAALAYGVQAIPSCFLIGPDGKMIGFGYRENQLEQALESLLK